MIPSVQAYAGATISIPDLSGAVETTAIPVAVRSLDEFLSRFGVPGYLSRMEFLLYQYFENGGTLALVVRVCRSERRNQVVLPAGKR